MHMKDTSNKNDLKKEISKPTPKKVQNYKRISFVIQSWLIVGRIPMFCM